MCGSEECIPNSPSRARTIPAFSSTMPDIALSPSSQRRAIELVDQQLAHVFVGQAGDELANRIVRQRFRQRRGGVLRLGALALRVGRADRSDRENHSQETGRNQPANSIERVHRDVPSHPRRRANRIVILLSSPLAGGVDQVTVGPVIAGAPAGLRTQN
jgi:hypothetical protein